MAILSLPVELACHILSLLSPRDICRCAMTCKILWNVARKSVYIQHKLELHAEGFTETATLDSILVFKKRSSLNKLVSLWRSDFQLETVFNEAVTVFATDEPWQSHLSWSQSVKCGVWWMSAYGGLFIRDCNINTDPSRTWPKHTLLSQPPMSLTTVDPLQDLTVTVSSLGFLTMVEEDHHPFAVEFRLASSQRPHPDAVCASLDCQHPLDAPGSYHVGFLAEPIICGDRVFIYYYVEPIEVMTVSTTFIQVVDWRKGYAMNCHLLDPRNLSQQFHVIDQWTIVGISSRSLSVYTLQELDKPPQLRLSYLLPERRGSSTALTIIHASPSFCGTAARPELTPGHVPSIESQILVLELVSDPPTPSIILVIDTVIFSGMALQSETHVAIPWSDWGPQHTCCFLHDPMHQMSVFGSKLAYALPHEHHPEPGQVLEDLFARRHFYVHVWDFNTRMISRSEDHHDASSSNLTIRKPSVVSHSCFYEDIVSVHPYTAIAYRTPFPTNGFSRIFLEQDRITLTWVRDFDTVDIRVVSPVTTDGGCVGPHTLE